MKNEQNISTQVRSFFPVLNKTRRNKPFIYLDSAATALKPTMVADAVAKYYNEYGVNIHRGPYTLSQKVTDAYEAVREKTARFINAPTSDQIIFTKNCTESINIISRSLARSYLKPGDEIVLTPLEHHANLIPWQEAAKLSGAVLRFLPVSAEGVLQGHAEKLHGHTERSGEKSEEKGGTSQMDSGCGGHNGYGSFITPKTKVVAITGMSNITGYIPPVAEIVSRAREAGALTVVDGAQLAGHTPVNMAEMGCDFFSFSAHKLCGPTGVGVLYGRKQALEMLQPANYGGGMISRVKLNSATYAGLPTRLEGGTPNIEGVLGFGAALDFLSGLGMEQVFIHESRLALMLREKSREVPGFELYGPKDASLCGGIVSFGIRGVHPHDVAALLDEEGIAVRAGFHCARPFIDHLGVIGTVRASFHVYNTPREVDVLVSVLSGVYEVFS